MRKKSKFVKRLFYVAAIAVAILCTLCFTACGSITPDDGIGDTVAVTSVTLDKTSLTLGVGEEQTLVAAVLPDNATDKTVTWKSSDENKATVDTTGKVKGVAFGTATITATAGDKTATCAVTVSEATVAVTTVTLDKTSLTLGVGEEQTLVAAVLPDNATDKTVTWKSSDESKATVDTTGKVKGVAFGTATITATAGDKTATCAVTVSEATVAVTTVTLDKTSLTLGVGEEQTLVAAVADSVTNKTVTWKSSDTQKVTVDANGKVKGIALGTANVTATVDGKSAICAVKVVTRTVTDEEFVNAFDSDVFINCTFVLEQTQKNNGRQTYDKFTTYLLKDRELSRTIRDKNSDEGWDDEIIVKNGDNYDSYTNTKNDGWFKIATDYNSFPDWISGPIDSLLEIFNGTDYGGPAIKDAFEFTYSAEKMAYIGTANELGIEHNMDKSYPYISIKFADGKLDEFSLKLIQGSNYVLFEKYSFSDYGSTTVELPSSFKIGAHNFTSKTDIIQITEGESIQLTISDYFTFEPANAEFATLIWESADPSIATVDQTGKVVGVEDRSTDVGIKVNVGYCTLYFYVSVNIPNGEQVTTEQWDAAFEPSVFDNCTAFIYDGSLDVLYTIKRDKINKRLEIQIIDQRSQINNRVFVFIYEGDKWYKYESSDVFYRMYVKSEYTEGDPFEIENVGLSLIEKNLSFAGKFGSFTKGSNEGSADDVLYTCDETIELVAGDFSVNGIRAIFVGGKIRDLQYTKEVNETTRWSPPNYFYITRYSAYGTTVVDIPTFDQIIQPEE